MRDFDAERLDGLLASLNSYMGHLRQADSLRLMASIVGEHPFLGAFFHRHGFKFEAVWACRGRYAHLAAQYACYRRRYSGYLLLFQVGRYLECYDTQARFLHERLGLGLIAPRKGFRLRCGWPLARAASLLQRLQVQGVGFVLVLQTERWAGRVRERRPRIARRGGVLVAPSCGGGGACPSLTYRMSRRGRAGVRQAARIGYNGQPTLVDPTW